MKNKFSIAMSLAVALAMLLTSVGLADNVVNDVTVGGSDTFTAPGSTTVGYKINTAAAGDPQSGCNASDGSPATVTLTVPAGVTASVTSLTFTACNVFQYVTFSSSAAGTYAINVSSISDNGTGSYNNQANFTLHVNAAPVTNTAPTVTVTGVTNGASYEIGSVPAATCQVTDAEDGSSSFAATLSGTLSAYGLGSQTASCSYTDGGGLSDSDSATYTIVDTTNPVITFVSLTAANGNGWNNDNVTVNWSCSDSGSGVVSALINQTVSTEGSNQSATGTCTDNAGNTASDTQTGINIDKTAPVVTVTGVSNGATYTLGSVPAAGCSTTDALSGVATNASLSISGGLVGSVTASCSGALDNADNPGSASVAYNVVYAWTGFFQPIDNNGTFNVVKSGSTIPVKFSLGGDQGLAILAAGSPTSAQIACPTSAPLDTIEELSTSTVSGLKYDALANQYIYNWKTASSYAGTCRQLTVKLVDGTTHSALFKFTK